MPTAPPAAGPARRSPRFPLRPIARNVWFRGFARSGRDEGAGGVAKDPYAELGVPRNASADDIRRAYRALAKELHPDARPGDKVAEERFKRITAAFNLLSDPDKRRRYDRGEIDADGNERVRGFGGGRGAAGQGQSQGVDPFEDIGDIFAGMFGGDGAGRGPFQARGGDMRYKLAVGFLEAANGARKRVVMGDGKALDLAIPEGVKTGQVLRLRGQGRRPGAGGPPGDALVEIEVEAHPFFAREGDDVSLDLPITLSEAVLGAKVRAPTLTGPVTVAIPKGSNSGTVLRLRGKGVKGDRGHGDQLIRLVVTLPERPDPELQRFAQDWTPPAGYDPRKKLGE